MNALNQKKVNHIPTESTITWLYTLLCKQGTHYVGITGDINNRLNKHFKGKGAVVTQHYAPIKVVELVPFTSRKAAEMAESYKTNELRQILGKDKAYGAGKTCLKVLPHIEEEAHHARAAELDKLRQWDVLQQVCDGAAACLREHIADINGCRANDLVNGLTWLAQCLEERSAEDLESYTQKAGE